MKFINSKIHGVIDYVANIVFLFAPAFFEFSPLVSATCYTVAGAHFLMNICTKYELGLIRLMPFSVHGGIELLAAFFLVLMPWALGFSVEMEARNFFIAAGGALFLVWLTTDYHQTGKESLLEKGKEESFRQAG